MKISLTILIIAIIVSLIIGIIIGFLIGRNLYETNYMGMRKHKRLKL